MTDKGCMRPWRTRPLTPGERALCLETFGAELDLDRVRLWSCPPLAWTTGRPFCAGGWLWPGRRLLVYPPAQAHADFAEATLWDQSVFLHEMTHVWQSQQGVNLLWAKLRAGDGAAAYAYELTPGCLWAGFNIEQQAMLVQHAFLQRRGRAAPHPEAAYLAVLPFAPASPVHDEAPHQALAGPSTSPT
ncbi:MAG: hypothetical protein KY449_04565 [Proteobacteria bacterium]|nr:hypothetical protein [Pseudomonadota bacterium]